MARNNVHMAIGLPGKNGVISGMRNSCDTVIEINLLKAVKSGRMPFYTSTNNVVLTPGEGEKGLVPPEFFRSVFDPKSGQYLYQAPIKYLLVYDFECNCSKDRSAIKFNEIVEFPVVIIDLSTNQVAYEFHTYVRPVVEKELNPFCTELTGITNEMVLKEGTPTLQEALQNLHNFLEEKGILSEEFVLCSCGDFDGNQLIREARFKNFSYPSYMKRWINFKKVIPPKQILQTG